MKTNTALTRYKKSVEAHEEVWTRILIGAAFWETKTKVTVTESGLLRGNYTVAYIPFSEADEPPANGDILVKGTLEVSIEGNMNVAELLKLYPDSMVVKSVNPKDYGSERMRHWQVEGS